MDLAAYERRLPLTALRPLYRTAGRGRSPFTEDHHRLRAIFVHVPKTAGRSVQAALAGGRSSHVPIKRFLGYDPAATRTYFTFAIVRNPWDRFVSAFNHLQRAARGSTEFARWVQSQRPGGLTDIEHFLDWIETTGQRKAVMGWLHFRPQHTWVCMKGRIAVDYVARYERLDEEWAAICDRIGLRYEPLSRVGIRHEGKRPALSPRAVEVIGDMYRRDADLLGYQPPPSSGSGGGV